MNVATNCNDQIPAIRLSHSFTLILFGIDEITPDIENKLFEAGCDDATLGIREGVPFLAFDREADSLADAVNSAIADVNRAGLGIEVVRVVLAGEETISVINAYLKLRREISGTLPKDLAHRIDEIMQAVGTHRPDVLRTLLTSM